MLTLVQPVGTCKTLRFCMVSLEKDNKNAWSSMQTINIILIDSVMFYFHFCSALLSWIAFSACFFQVQKFYFTQVWKRCGKLLSSHYCYTVSLLVLHFKTTAKHLCSYFRLVQGRCAQLCYLDFCKILKV